MPVLTKCIECGESASSEAKRCPHCGKYPHSVPCYICEKNIRRQDAGFERGYAHWGDFVCTKCTTSILSESFYCPACKNDYQYRLLVSIDKSQQANNREKMVCPQCGQPMKFTKCYSCELSLHILDGVKRYYEYSGDYGPARDDIFFHNHCIQYSKYKKVSNSNCFIASAVTGEDSVEVLCLRIFKDEYLSTKQSGLIFISLYNYIGPPLSAIMRRSNFLRTIVQLFIITPLYRIIKNKFGGSF